MNKEQEIIALSVIKYLKNNNGLTTLQNIMNNVDGFNNSRHVIMRGLGELKLIDNLSNSSFILTIKGYNFISFNDLRKKQAIKGLKDNISFIVNILLMVATIYLSVINSQLSKRNESLTGELIESKVELLQLKTKVDYHLIKHGVIQTDTIK